MDQSAKFSDIYISNYSVIPVNDSNIIDSPQYLKKDIRISRDNINYQIINEHCIFTVNGLYHNSFLNNQIIIKDAYKSMQISKQNNIGIYSFRNVGKITRISLTEDKVFPNGDGTAFVQVDQDITNKRIFIVIAGYFHVIDNDIFYQTGPNTFKIDFNKMSLLDRYFELKEFIDLSSLPLTFPIGNPDLVNVEQLLEDDNLKAMLLFSQSFIVILDTPNIQINRLGNVKKTGFPGQYISYSEPKYPLVNGLGRHCEYIKEKEELFLKDRPYNKDQWIISVYNNIVYNRLYSTTLANYLENTDGNLRPAYPGEYSDAYFLEIKKI